MVKQRTIGLAAGAGDLPLEFTRSAKEKGDRVVVSAVKGVTSPTIEDIADKINWVEFGQIAKAAFFFAKEGARNLVLLGKISKGDIYKENDYDDDSKKIFSGAKGKRDYKILKEVTKYLSKIGINVINPCEYLSHLLLNEGYFCGGSNDKNLNDSMDFGYKIARDIAGMDIGQTVIVKDMNVVAVEAVEGTDAVIERGGLLAGDGCIMVKVSRPNQDMRWDIPTIGYNTAELLVKHGYKGLLLESGKMFVLNRDEIREKAEKNGLTIRAI